MERVKYYIWEQCTKWTGGRRGKNEESSVVADKRLGAYFRVLAMGTKWMGELNPANSPLEL